MRNSNFGIEYEMMKHLEAIAKIYLEQHSKATEYLSLAIILDEDDRNKVWLHFGNAEEVDKSVYVER